MSVLQRNFEKANGVSRTKLRRNAQIDCDHMSYFWIAADGLAISQKQNRFAARWNLNCAGCNRFRNKIGFVLAFQFRTIKAKAHAIGICRNREFVNRELLNPYIVKSVPIYAPNETETRMSLRRTHPIMRT